MPDLYALVLKTGNATVGAEDEYRIESEEDVVTTEQGYKITTADNRVVHIQSDEVDEISIESY